MGFEDFEPIFGEPKPVWANNSDSVPLRRFLMHLYAADYFHLKINVTDFHSNTFQAIKSVPQLDDMRDSIGIGGSWSEFLDYVVASVKSDDVKLVLDKHCDSDGVAYAKLVAQKSKRMPIVSISLTKIVDSAASDAMENMSFGLFKAFECMQNLVIQEQENSSQLTKVISAERESSECTHSQLEKRQKSSSYKVVVSAPLASNGSQDSPDKQAARDTASTKVTSRVLPAYRRAKVRGAFLHDTEEDKDN